jgi:hypothetical protein
MKALMETIKNEVDAYKKNKEESETALLEIGNRLKPLFTKGNLKFEDVDAYLHEGKKTVINTTNKFSWHDMLDQKGDFVKIEFKTKEVKEAWLNVEAHNELIGLGVNVDTENAIEVKVSEK